MQTILQKKIFIFGMEMDHVNFLIHVDLDIVK